MPPVDLLAILLASSPEDAVLRARELVEGQGGFCAAFSKDDPMNPKKMRWWRFMVRFMRMGFTGLKHVMDDTVASWTMRQRWKLVWQGRVAANVEMLQKMRPDEIVNVIAIKGGRHCDWEVEQLSDGGELKELFPIIKLTIFEDGAGFEQALSRGSLKLFPHRERID